MVLHICSRHLPFAQSLTCCSRSVPPGAALTLPSTSAEGRPGTTPRSSVSKHGPHLSGIRSEGLRGGCSGDLRPLGAAVGPPRRQQAALAQPPPGGPQRRPSAGTPGPRWHLGAPLRRLSRLVRFSLLKCLGRKGEASQKRGR